MNFKTEVTHHRPLLTLLLLLCLWSTSACAPPTRPLPPSTTSGLLAPSAWRAALAPHLEYYDASDINYIVANIFKAEDSVDTRQSFHLLSGEEQVTVNVGGGRTVLVSLRAQTNTSNVWRSRSTYFFYGQSTSITVLPGRSTSATIHIRLNTTPGDTYSEAPMVARFYNEDGDFYSNKKVSLRRISDGFIFQDIWTINEQGFALASFWSNASGYFDVLIDQQLVATKFRFGASTLNLGAASSSGSDGSVGIFRYGFGLVEATLTNPAYVIGLFGKHLVSDWTGRDDDGNGTTNGAELTAANNPWGTGTLESITSSTGFSAAALVPAITVAENTQQGVLLKWKKAPSLAGNIDYKLLQANSFASMATLALAETLTDDHVQMDWTQNVLSHFVFLPDDQKTYFAVVAQDAGGHKVFYPPVAIDH